MVEIWRQYQRGEGDAARRNHHALLPLFDGLFIESNPIPIKTLVAKHLGCCTRDLRLPMTPLSAESESILDGICQRLEIGPESP
jgi:4-hydroxy-tetrahydrodipicolinate synthase